MATKLEDESGYNIVCGDDVVGTINHGEVGEACEVTDFYNGEVVIECANTEATVFKAMCFRTPYDPDSLVCKRGVLYKECGEDLINIDTYFCVDDKAYGKCNGTTVYDPSTQFCAIDDHVYELCGVDKMSDDPAREFCAVNDAVNKTTGIYPKCQVDDHGNNGLSYDPLGYFCAVNNKILPLCDSKTYNPALQFCFTDNTGAEPYEEIVDYCVQGETKQLFDPRTQFCFVDKTYAAVTDYCVNGEKNQKLDPRTQFCADDNSVQDYCVVNGVNKKFSPATQFCAVNNTVQTLCGGKTFDPTTQFCYRTNTKEKIGEICGEYGKTEASAFDPDQYMCADEPEDGIEPEIVKYVKLVDMYWMAENRTKNPDLCLPGDVKCANGGLYKYESAVNACPVGWRLPTKVDFDNLVELAESVEDGLASLKAASWNGTDKFGFGMKKSGYVFNYLEPAANSENNQARFWSSTTTGEKAYTLWVKAATIADAEDSYAFVSSYAVSVRCVKDVEAE